LRGNKNVVEQVRKKKAGRNADYTSISRVTEIDPYTISGLTILKSFGYNNHDRQ
jgi:hypothetical protein